MELTFEDAKYNSVEILKDVFLDKMQEQFPHNIFNKYKDDLAKIIMYHVKPIGNDVIKKNEDKLEIFFKDLVEDKTNTAENIQEKFNVEVNNFINMWGKIKLTAKTAIMTKDSATYLKYSEGAFSKNNKKRTKEERNFNKVKKTYSL